MANISKVYLLNTPLEDDMKNTLYFASASDQQSYMQNNILKSYLNVSYQRDTSTFRCPAHIDTIRNCNYMMYQNTAYSNKWFYCFIKKMTYISDGLTDVEFEVDPIQTFMFDITLRPSFIEREHTNDDTVGANTVPEQVERGEYISNGFQRDDGLGALAYIIQATEHYDYDPDDPNTRGQMATNFGGVYNAGTVFYVEDILSLLYVIGEYDDNGKGDAITNVYVVPQAIVANKPSVPIYDPGENWWRGMTDPVTYTKSVSKQTTLNGYSPRNRKLLTYPYNVLVLDNNNGSSTTLKYEDFSTDDCVFEIAGVPTCGCSIKIAPKDYRGESRYQQEGIMAGKFPTCGWVNDAYTNWMTQNAVNLNIGAVADVAQTIVGVAGGIAGGKPVSAIGSAVSGVSSIASTIGEVYQHSLLPATAGGNINGGDINTCYNMNKFYFIKLSIKAEYARIIDDFFDMFGYATHRVKTPNTAHRQNWWYTKTIDCNITGNVPNDYMNQIKDAYNNGITFWRNPSNFLNYSVSNGIV